MNKSTLRNLAIVLFALVAIMVGFEMSDKATTTSGGDLLLPGLKDRINSVSSITVEAPGDDPTTIINESGTWSVANRWDYPADIGTIREVLLALADARILEQKTSDPERYAQLGVLEPAGGGEGESTRIAVAGDDFSYDLLVGNINQGSNRFVRRVDEAPSLLIDQNPPLPDAVSGWLRADLIDIDAANVEMVTVRHADGETINVFKSSPEETDFQVQDLPQDRELSYPTVANSIAAALSDLQLEDVRRGEPGDASATVDFETFDGLRIAVTVFEEEEAAWVALHTAANDPLEAAAAETAQDSVEIPVEDSVGKPAAVAAATNQRLLGWQFQIPEFKLNQLTRRWDDILKAESD